MILPCHPPDGRDPEELNCVGKSFADCVLLAERELVDVELNPDDPKLWHQLYLKIRGTKTRFVDAFGPLKPVVDPKDLRAARRVLERVNDLLPPNADPKLRNCLKKDSQILNCNDAQELKLVLRESMKELFTQ